MCKIANFRTPADQLSQYASAYTAQFDTGNYGGPGGPGMPPGMYQGNYSTSMAQGAGFLNGPGFSPFGSVNPFTASLQSLQKPGAY